MAAEALLAQWQGGVNDGVKEASASEIVALLDLDAAHAHLPVLLPAAFDESDPSLYAERLNSAARKLLTQLEGGTFAEPIAKKVVEWLNAQLDHLSDAQLVQIIELILSGLPRTVGSRSHAGSTRPIELLPNCINLAREMEKCNICTADGHTLESGGAVLEYAVRRIQHANWSASGMLGLATVLREMRIPQVRISSNQLTPARTCSNLLYCALMCSNHLEGRCELPRAASESPEMSSESSHDLLMVPS
jgi:hypothetical protein|tara:strand:+ start:851 stop:1594 length:744 start_codon:yes stop_codon:yes gene_type:complete